MIRYLFGQELGNYPKLRDSMFQDRAEQFHRRLGWQVRVSNSGEERDRYDALNPLYVIWQKADGGHGGSMRFLPTTGATMVNDHFRDLLKGQEICDTTIWECTRFCLSPDAGPRVSAALMLGGAEVGLQFDLRQSVGVFDARMVRIYRRLGWPPTILGTSGTGKDAISVGLWKFSPETRRNLHRKAGLSDAISTLWRTRAFDLPARFAQVA